MLTSMEGRTLENPMRGVQIRLDAPAPLASVVRATREGGTARVDGDGPLELDCVVTREAKVMRAGLPVDPTPWRIRSGSPSQVSVDVPTPTKRPRRACEEGQRFATRAGVYDTALRLVLQWRRRGRPCRPRHLLETAAPLGVRQPAHRADL
jgi:hypothetical protein